MAIDVSNDNVEVGLGLRPDAHGQAALLLVESLVHGLIARRVITVADAVEIVDVAAEVTADLGIDRGDPPARRRCSMHLLNAVSSSLRADIQQG